ncbi:MAG: hypothetical protein BZY88_09805 [SAR202 cluster bacterium Io17-Chloro-G9]|nr:MAG: hypothetical protein BZY88_09805 [SAR202 cluster bacterium Io17-Chloro-G9]
MSQFWRTSSVTGVTLFLDACAFYLLFGIVGNSLQQPEAVLPFWLVMLTLVWAFLLSMYVQTVRFTSNIRGYLGMAISIVSVLLLASLNSGIGLALVGAIITGDISQAFTMALSIGFLVALWWRSGTVSHDEVSFDTVRSSFQWGTVMMFIAVLFDGVSPYTIVNGFLVMGFFSVGLSGLALARFSSETGGSQTMSMDWWLPIGASVIAVLLLGLLASALGLGGLDEVTRSTLGMVGFVGLWVVKPFLLILGVIAGVLVAFFNWISSIFGGGDLSGLERAAMQIQQFHESMREEAGDGGPPAILVNLLKGLGFVAGAGVAGWVLFRIFRIRRGWRPPSDVEESRESIFSWGKANNDLSAFLAEWWRNLGNARDSGEKIPGEPGTPREFYHGLLRLAQGIGQPRREWQTPKEHQWDLKDLMPDNPVNRIVDGFQSAHYGHQESSEEDIDYLRRDWLEIKEYLTREERAAKAGGEPDGAPDGTATEAGE